MMGWSRSGSIDSDSNNLSPYCILFQDYTKLKQSLWFLAHHIIMFCCHEYDRIDLSMMYERFIVCPPEMIILDVNVRVLNFSAATSTVMI